MDIDLWIMRNKPKDASKIIMNEKTADYYAYICAGVPVKMAKDAKIQGLEVVIDNSKETIEFT